MTTWPLTRYSLLSRLGDAEDHAAWLEFERVYQPAVYRYARSRGLQSADAAEVVQEVMLAVHRAVGDWQPTHRAGSFRAWLAEAGRRITLQMVRQRSKADRGAGGSSVRAVLEAIEATGEAGSEEADHRRWLFFSAQADAAVDATMNVRLMNQVLQRSKG